jgi:hypothetical protein
MSNARCLVLIGVLALAACHSAPRKTEWFDRQTTPGGRYEKAKFVTATDIEIQNQLLALEKLEETVESDDGARDAGRIIRTLAREAQRGNLSQVCEHIVWKLSSRPDTAHKHEIALLDFLARCQEVIFEIGGDDAPSIEALSAFGINANRRAAFLKILIAKANSALHRLLDADRGATYGALVCDILERAEWGAVSLVPRERNPESAEYRRSTTEALARYRERLSR